MNNELLEKLAALEHKQWCRKTRFMMAKLQIFPHHSNADVRSLWRQSTIPYKELSEKEKESDRVWARKVLEIMELK